MEHCTPSFTAHMRLDISSHPAARELLEAQAGADSCHTPLSTMGLPPTGTYRKAPDGKDHTSLAHLSTCMWEAHKHLLNE